jgi:hypothetical protein
MAMLSDDMLLAAKWDGLDQHFAYAVAGAGSDSDAGICYQVQVLQAEKYWRDDFPFLMVQVINSGFDVMAGQLDIFMGAGGFGYFTAANSDCQTNFCKGGPCQQGLYAGNFDAWTNAQYPDPNQCYSGGIKWEPSTGEDFIWGLCRKLSGGQSKMKDKVLWDSCARSNVAYFHQNYYGTNYLRVRCPEGLYRLTGLRRQDDDSYPDAHPQNNLNLHCGGSISQGQTCISTMADFCVPSASWSGKVNTIEGYGRVDRCDFDGLPL